MLKHCKKDVSNDDTDSDSDDDKPPSHKPDDYIKCRVPLKWDDNERTFLDVVKTSFVIVNDDKNSEHFKNDGKYTHVEITDMDSLRKNFRYMGNYRIQLHLSKIWANKQPSMGSSKRLYGATWKLNRILVNRSELRSYANRDDDDDDVDDLEAPSDSDDDNEDELVGKFLEEKKNQNEDDDEDENEEDDDEEEDDDDDDESEEEIEKPVVKAKSKRKTRKAKTSV